MGGLAAAYGKMARMGKGKSDDIAESLRRVIRAAIRDGMSQNKIAAAAGISSGQITKLLREERTPNLATAERVLRALGHRLTIQKI